MTSVAEKLQRKELRQSSPKQVRLKLVYIDFWSVVKLSFLIWLCLGIVLVVASVLVWLVLYSTGIFDRIDDTLRDILVDANFTVTEAFGIGRVLLFSVIIAGLNTIVGTALGAIAAVLYNLSVRLTGGLLVGFQNN